MDKPFDVRVLFGHAEEFLATIAGVQEALAGSAVEASAGGGMVTAVVNGKLEVVQIRIDQSLLDARDMEMLQDLVVAAVNEGIRAAQKMTADEMGKLTGGLGFKLPGMP